MSKKRILSFLLAIIMIVTNFTPVFANSTGGSTKTSPKELNVKTVEDSRGNKKNSIEISRLEETKTRSMTPVFFRNARFANLQSGTRAAEETWDAEINVKITKFGIGGDSFDWDEVFGKGETFEVQAFYRDENDQKIYVGTPQTVNKGDTSLKFNVTIPKTANSINIETSFIDKLGIKAYERHEAGKGNDEGSGDAKYYLDLDLHQIYNPFINVMWLNPYGTKVRGASDAKASFNKGEFNIIDSNRQINLRDAEIFDEDAEDFIEDYDLKDLTNKNLEVVGANEGKVTYGDKTYKVTVKKPTAKDPGEIKFVEQPKIITPGENEKPGDTAPDGYKRLSFHAESGKNEQDGLFNDATKVKIIDVLEGTKFNDKDLLEKIGAIEKPYPVINGKADPNKKFLKWNPALPTDQTTGEVADTSYWPVYLANGDEVGENDKLPEGTHKVEVTRDEASIKKNDLYGKTYAVFDGKTLAREKFPKLEAAKDYDNPKWTATPEGGQAADEANPWDRVINKNTEFKATASKLPDIIENPTKPTPEGYVRVTFVAGEGVEAFKDAKTYDVKEGTALTKEQYPIAKAKVGYKDPTWNVAPGTAITSANNTITATATEIDDIVPGGPGVDKPEGYYVVEFLEGKHGKFKPVSEKAQVTVYYVRPEAKVKMSQIKAPTVTANTGYVFDSWSKDYQADAVITGDRQITAVYRYVAGVSTEAKEGWTKVTLKSGENGQFTKTTNVEGGQTKTEEFDELVYYVDPEREVTIPAPVVKAKVGSTFTGFDKPLTGTFKTETTINAKYLSTSDVIEDKTPGDDTEKPEGYVTVKFEAGQNGTFAANSVTKYFVNPEREVEIGAPGVEPNKNFVFKGFFNGTEEHSSAKKKYAKDVTYTAKYEDKSNESIIPGDQSKPGGWVTVSFSAGEHGTFELVNGKQPTIAYHVNPEKDVVLKEKAPTVKANDGYKFTKYDPDVETARKYTTEGQVITAQYKATVVTKDPNDTEHYAKVEFLPGDQGKFEQVGGKNQVTTFWVWKGEEVKFNAPKVTANENYKFKEWDKPIQETYDADTTHTATYESTQDVSDTEVKGYNKVTFKAGEHGTLTEKSVWVKPDTLVDLNDKAPKVTPEKGYSHIGWKPGLVGKFENNTNIVAQYSNNISDTPVEGWTELTFDQGDHGKLAKGAKNVKWVNPKADLKLSEIAPAIVADTNYSLDGWKDGETKVKLETAQKFENPKTFVATYKSNVLDKKDYDKLPEEEKKNFVQITFNEGDHGKFPKEAVKEVYVKKDVEVDLTEKAPTVIPNQGYGHSGWEPALKGTFSTATTITAQYKEGTFDENAIKEIIVLGPTKMGYGVGEKLDLTGLKIIAKDDAGLQKTYEGVDAITKAGFTIEPADKTELKMADNGKHIVVTKGQDPNKVTGQTETTLTIHENKSAKAEDVKALNQNKVVEGKVTNEPKDTTTVTGKVKPGSTVKITDEQGNDITPNDGVKVENDGTFTAEVTKQDEGKKVKVIVTEEGKQPSDPAEATVARDANNDGKADSDADQKTATPTAKALNVGEKPEFTTITGKAEKGATVIAKVDGVEVGKATADANTGDYTIKAKKDNAALVKDTEVKVTAQVEGKLVSDPTATVVKIDKDGNGIADVDEQTERPAAIASNKGKNPAFTTIEGKTEKGATITVTVKVNGEEKPVTVENLKVNDDGTYTLGAKYDGKALENGAEILVYAENAPKTKSAPQTTTVFNDFNNDGKPDGGKVDLTNVKDIQVIAPEKMSYTQGDKLDGTGLKAVIRDNKGGIEIFDYDNATGKFKDADGKEVADITATVAGKAIKDLALTEKDHNGKAIDVKVGDKNGSTNQKLEVKQLQTPTPTIEFAANQNTVGSNGQATQTAKQKTTVKFTVVNKPTTVYVKYTENGVAKEESFDIGANDDATNTVDLQVKLPIGAEVQVLAKDADKTLSKPATAKVARDANNDGTADDKTEVGKATIDPIKAQSEKITVKPADNATELVITETDKSGNTPEGSTPITVKKDKDGNWKIGDTPVEKDEETGKLTIPTKNKLKLDEYNVVEVESKGDPETTTPSTSKEVVGKAKDTTAPDKPKVDQPVDGDKDIKVKTPTDKDAKTIIVKVTKPAAPAAPGEEQKPDKVETITVTKDGDNWKIGDTPVIEDENGKLVIPVPELKTDDTVTVEVKDETGNTSVPDSQKVVERQKLDPPTINPIKTGEKTVAGKAEKAATVDIYKKVGDKYEPLAKDVGVSPDGSFTYNNKDGFKDGDVIRVVAKKPGMTSNNAETTVGVDTSALDKAITNGKGELDKRKDGTPADKALEEAIKEGEDLKKKTPAPSQEEVDKAKDKIEKAIEEKKETDKALDELKKAKEELDKTIKDAEADEKPDEAIEKGQKASDDADTVIKNKGEGKTATEIKKLVEKTNEENRTLRLPVIQVAISSVAREGQTIVFKTNPGRCKVNITITRSDFSEEKYEVETGAGGTGSIKIENALKAGDAIDIKASRKTKDRPIPDYLDNFTGTEV